MKLVPPWAEEAARLGLELAIANLRASMGMLTPDEAAAIIAQVESDMAACFEAE